MGLANTEAAADSRGSEGLSFNMKQKLCTLAFVLALLNTELDFFHSRKEGDGTLKTQGAACISTRIDLATSQSPVCGSLKYFPHDPTESLTSTDNIRVCYLRCKKTIGRLT